LRIGTRFIIVNLTIRLTSFITGSNKIQVQEVIMSKVRLLSFSLTMFIFLTGAIILEEARGDHFDSSHIFYHGHYVADIASSIMSDPEFQKCELYRDGDLVHTWANTRGNWSDTVTWGAHTYQAWLYRWIGDRWGGPDKSQFVPINSNSVAGQIHNNDAWLNELGRGPVNWSSGTFNLKGFIYVVDGTLEISSDVTVVMNGSGFNVLTSGAALEADGATFLHPEGLEGRFHFEGLYNPTAPVFQNCTFIGTDFQIDMEYSRGVQIVGNNFTGVNIYIEHPSINCLIQANTGSESRINSWTEYSTTIRENVGMEIDVDSNAVVIGNQAPWIITSNYGGNNTIQQNTVDKISIKGWNNLVLNNTVEDTGEELFKHLVTVEGTGHIIQDNEISALVPGYPDRAGICLTGEFTTTTGITVEGNNIYEIIGYGILLEGSDHNLIKKNNLLENLGGIALEDSSHNNIENNACNENLDIGLELTGDSYDNAIAFNHIWGGESGIVIGEDAHGNGLHENKVEYNDVGIYLESRNNYIQNNIFRRNLTNALDDGADNTWSRVSAVEASNIVGGPYLGGNYWDDYKGADSDGDGIGETPYAIFGAFTDAVSCDNLPLIWDDDTPPYLVLNDGDYNGDGSSDIAIFRKSSGLWAVRGVTRVYFGGGGDIPVSGDYNGNGTTDISIFRRSSGLWAVRGVTRLYYGASTDTAVPGDYNGDGRCDPGIFRESMGLWAIRGVTRTYFGQPLDRPVPGNYSGAGFASIALFRPSSGLWAIKDLGRIYFGNDEDMPAAADYDGNGTRDLAIFRRSMGLWAVAGVTRAYFGGLYDRPAPADYAGTSADNIALFREMSGLWAVRGVTRIYFGGDGDIPATR
jgi:parallel beta-helix repeat protein